MERAAAVADALTLLAYDDEAGTLRRACRLRPARRGLALVSDAVAGDASAETVAALRYQLVDDRNGSVDCAAGYDASWIGRSVEVHDLPTNFGAVSYALRWHGEHPALLWELDADKPVRITARAIDPEWATDERAGETLLGVATRRA